MVLNVVLSNALVRRPVRVRVLRADVVDAVGIWVEEWRGRSGELEQSSGDK